MTSQLSSNSKLSVNKVGRPQGRKREQTRKILLQCARTSFNQNAVDAHEKDSALTIFLAASQVEMTRYPELRRDKDDLHRVMRTTLENIFQQAIDKGEIPSHLSAGDLLTTFIGGAMGMASFEVCMKSGSMRVGVETLLDLLPWSLD